MTPGLSWLLGFDKPHVSWQLRAMRTLTGLVWTLLAVNAWSGPVPDFRLADANPNSARRGALVSPRDYLLQVSGYYFGEAS